MAMDIIDLYKSILSCGGLTTDEGGLVSVKSTSKDNIPALVNGKRLVIPTTKHLTDFNDGSKIIFHPLSENILRGESEILTKLRSVFNIRINYTFVGVAMELLKVIADNDTHRKLTLDQSEILSAIKNVDGLTCTNFSRLVVNAAKESTEDPFINIFLKRGGTIGDKKHSRVGIVKFPLYNQLKEDKNTFYGIKLREKDKESIIQLFQYLFPDIDKPEAYNRGSDSNVAPYLDALMKTLLGIAGKFNDVIELFSKHIEKSEELVFNSDWVETFDNLDVMRLQIRQIPTQAGNEGSSKQGESPVATTIQTTPVQQLHAPVVVQHQPVPVVNQFGQPIYQPQLQQPPAIVQTEKGLDFNSIIRANPALAASALNFGPRPNVPQYQQPQQVPRWALNNPNNFQNNNNGNFNNGFNNGSNNNNGWNNGYNNGLPGGSV